MRPSKSVRIKSRSSKSAVMYSRTACESVPRSGQCTRKRKRVMALISSALCVTGGGPMMMDVGFTMESPRAACTYFETRAAEYSKNERDRAIYRRQVAQVVDNTPQGVLVVLSHLYGSQRVATVLYQFFRWSIIYTRYSHVYTKCQTRWQLTKLTKLYPS